jgi:D-serine deaminase-like pyridoxal phosphate-dependent protein
MASYTAYKMIFRGRSLPLAYLDLDLLAANVAQVRTRAGTKPVRIASKSIRCLAILRRILAADPHFRGVLCFTAPEAVYLSQQGLDDLVIGYPCWQPTQIRAVCAEVAAGKTVVPMVDSLAHVRHLAELAGAAGVVLQVGLDLDMASDFPGLHFGAWRSRVRHPATARRLAQAIMDSPHLRLDGVMGYEAQIAGVGDMIPGRRVRNALIRLLKWRSQAEVAARRAALVAAITAAAGPLRFVNGGGTGSLESTSAEGCVTELTAGSAFYGPALLDRYAAFRPAPAAGFAIEIVRRPAPSIYTCSGGGYIASGPSGADRLPQPYLPPGVRLMATEGAGEVQTPICYGGPEPLALGDPIFLRHAKAGELCEHFSTLLLISDGRIVDEVPTYRGAGLCFL